MKKWPDRKGSKNYHAKLDDSQVYVIRQLYKNDGLSQIELAATFDVSQAQISRIVHNVRWIV